MSSEQTGVAGEQAESLKERVRRASGRRRIDDGYQCPLLGPVRIRTISEAEFQDGVLQWVRNKDWTLIPDRTKYENAKFLQMCLVDEHGNLEFTDSLEDISMLAGLQKPEFQALYQRAYQWNHPDTPKN